MLTVQFQYSKGGTEIMPTPKTRFGMFETVFSGEPELCSDPKCGRFVSNGDPCFYADGEILYCDACGRCVRYSRKKEVQRKQQIKEN